MYLPKGATAGEPFRLADFQKDWIREIYAPGVRAAVLQLPRANGKSTLLAGLALYEVFDTNPSGSPSVPVVAVTYQQAIRALYSVAVTMAETSPELAKRCIAYSAIGATRLYVPSTRGELFPLAAEVDAMQGLDPSFAILDEIGFAKQEAFDALYLASGKRPNSITVGVGTPGYDRENALYGIRQMVRDGGPLPSFVYREYAATDGCDINDVDEWYAANPALVEGYLSLDALEAAVRLTPEAAFRTFRLGQWVDGQEGWLGVDGAAAWAALRDAYEFDPTKPVYVGLDVGLYRDSSAVVVVQERPDGRLHAKSRIWVPSPGSPVDPLSIMDHLRELSATYSVAAIAYDPRLFEAPALMLAQEGLPLVTIHQSVDRMTPIIGEAYERIKAGKISHDADEAFTQQMLNPIPRLSERGFTLQKNKSRGRIDAAVALSLAIDRAVHKKPRYAPYVAI